MTAKGIIALSFILFIAWANIFMTPDPYRMKWASQVVYAYHAVISNIRNFWRNNYG